MTDFFIGDTHFGHVNIINFLAEQRPFKSIEEHDEALIANWNSVVSNNDVVWHLGDVFFGNDKLGNSVMSRLQGHKYVVLGNHDRYSRTKVIMRHFEKCYGVAYYKKGILSHIPVHPNQLEHRFKWNIHGHLHKNNLDDPRYINVSAEQINLTPISWEEIEERNKL